MTRMRTSAARIFQLPLTSTALVVFLPRAEKGSASFRRQHDGVDRTCNVIAYHNSKSDQEMG